MPYAARFGGDESIDLVRWRTVMQNVYLSVQFKCGSKVRRGVGMVSVHEIESALKSKLERVDPLALLLDRVKKDEPALRATVRSSKYETTLKIDNLAHVVGVQFDYELTLGDQAPPQSEASWEQFARLAHLGPLSTNGIVQTITEDEDFESPQATFQCEVFLQ
jgi:hypothetical protein